MSDEQPGIFSQIRDVLTTSVQEQEIPPVIDNQVVFPMVDKNDVAGLDGPDFLSKQHHLGVCLRSLIGRKVIGMRYASNDDPTIPSIGWVVALEDESTIVSPYADGMN